MTQTWFISDLHFGHGNILNFTNPDGTKLRPWTDTGEMAVDIIAKWNERVSDGDTVYVVGDVVWNGPSLHLIDACRGKKILVAGNHDTFNAARYLKHFTDVRGVAVINSNWVVTHIPIHPSCLEHRWELNIHGHLHAKAIGEPNQTRSDLRYFNVSVEAIDYAPVCAPEIAAKIERIKKARNHTYVLGRN